MLCCAFLCFLLRTWSLREQWNKSEITEFAYYHTPAHHVKPAQPSEPWLLVVKNGRTLFCHFDFEVGCCNLRFINNWLKSSNLSTKRCPLIDFFFHGHCPIHDPHPVEHENPGTNQGFLVKGVGLFSKWGGGSNWEDTKRGVFRKFICEHQQEKRRRGPECSGHTQWWLCISQDWVFWSQDRVPNCPWHSIGCQKACFKQGY